LYDRAIWTPPIPDATIGLTASARSMTWANVRSGYGVVESPDIGLGMSGRGIATP
jgi:hypothetical protein